MNLGIPSQCIDGYPWQLFEGNLRMSFDMIYTICLEHGVS